MFKSFITAIKKIFCSKRKVRNSAKENLEQVYMSAENVVQEDSNKKSNTNYAEFATQLNSAMIGFNLNYPTPIKFIEQYLSKYTKESFFEALKYIFAYDDVAPDEASTACSLIRYSRSELCEFLIDLNITPIHTWLKILSHNYNSELYYEDFSLEFLCDTIPEDVLIPFVVEDFENILKRTEPFDYYYFFKYKEWKEIFIANISKILKNANFNYAQEYFDIIKYFPECTLNVYEFILNSYSKQKEKNDLQQSIWDNLSLIDDVLQPMADYLLYTEKKSSFITEEFVTHFLSSLEHDFLLFIQAMQIFEERFNINPKLLDTIMKDNVRKYIHYLMNNKISISKNSNTIYTLFSSPYGYAYFMDNICTLLHCQGIELYSFLIQHFKDNKEIIEAEHCCYEYD